MYVNNYTSAIIVKIVLMRDCIIIIEQYYKYYRILISSALCTRIKLCIHIIIANLLRYIRVPMLFMKQAKNRQTSFS